MTNSENKMRTENILAATVAVLLAAVLLTFHAVGGVMARYTTAGSSNDEARVALFGHSETVSFDSWTDSLKPGDTKTITLSVSNAKDSKVSEVAQAYEIEVVTAGNLPFEFNLANGAGTSVALGSPTTGASGSFKTYTWTAGGMVFEPGVTRTDQYKLTVTWPDGQNAAAKADIPDFVQVNINVKQID